MAAHAGDAVRHGEVLAGRVPDDVCGSFIEWLAFAVIQKIGLEPVRQAENGFSAVVIEAMRAARPKRKLVQALSFAIAAKIIGRSEIAVVRHVPLD
jgi:hypothetical protein